jgi:hypothetical protein
VPVEVEQQQQHATKLQKNFNGDGATQINQPTKKGQIFQNPTKKIATMVEYKKSPSPQMCT